MDRRGRAERWLDAKTGVTKETGWNVYWSGANKERADEKNHLLKARQSGNQRDESVRKVHKPARPPHWVHLSPSPPKQKVRHLQQDHRSAVRPKFLDILESVQHKVEIDEDADLSMAEKVSLGRQTETRLPSKTNRWKQKAALPVLDSLQAELAREETGFPKVTRALRDEYRDQEQEFEELFSRMGREQHRQQSADPPDHKKVTLDASADDWLLEFTT